MAIDYIRILFDVEHISGDMNIVADVISRTCLSISFQHNEETYDSSKKKNLNYNLFIS